MLVLGDGAVEVEELYAGLVTKRVALGRMDGAGRFYRQVGEKEVSWGG